MKTEKNILIAFILNLSFSIFEFIGGTITNSVAVISDSIHDPKSDFELLHTVESVPSRKNKKEVIKNISICDF